MVKNRDYVYMDHLRALDSYRQRSDPSMLVISQEVYTPLSIEDWSLELADHPDREFSKFILNGITNGFCIGLPLQSAMANLHCANPEIITEYLGRETALCRMWKCPTGYIPHGVHISPLGLIPKKEQTRKVAYDNGSIRATRGEH